MLRSLVIGRLGRAGDKSVIEEAKKRFAAHANGEVKLIADLRQAVSMFCLISTAVKSNSIQDQKCNNVQYNLQIDFSQAPCHSSNVFFHRLYVLRCIRLC